MKKTRMGRTVWAAALIMCFTALFTTCENNIGLGRTVDIRPPTLNVLTIYPPAEAVIRDEFTLSIEAEDDSGIASVNANFTKTGITEQPDSAYTSFDLKKAEDGIHWTAKINTKKEDSSFPLPDGSYKVLLTATDTVGKTVRTESTLTIDNTAPLLILNRPSTTTADSSSDVFGDGFLLVGQVYDETPVAALTVTAKGKGETDPVFTKEVKNVPQNIRITVDAFSSDMKQKFYQGLYGTKREAGPKYYEYGITVTDDAKVYQAPGDNGVGPGNITDRYYLFDDLYSDVLSEYRIHTVYNMMRGTYSSVTEAGAARTAAEIKADKEKMKAVQDALEKAQLGGNNKRKGTFALNPSINPQFDIAGEKPESGEPEFSRLYSDSTLTVKVSCNLDGIPLEGADTYHFFLMEWTQFLTFADKDLPYPTAKINSDDIYADAAKKTVKPEFIELTKSKFEKEGSSYIFSVPVSAEGLTYGKRYVLLVRGKDKGEKNKPGNELIPDSKGVPGGVYGFTLAKTGKTPEVYVTKINDTVGTGADGTITERVYLKKGDELNFKMKLQPVAAKVTYTLKDAVGGDILSESKPYPAGEYEVIIEAAKFKQDADGTYKLTVKAEADEGTSLEQTYTIIYDVNGPEVKIAYPVGNLNGDEGNDLEIKGTAFDTGSGLADTDPVTVTLTKEDGSEVPVTFATDKKRENWELQPINLLEGKYTLKATAKDKLGQQSTPDTLVFTYDKAAPVITGLKVGEQTVKDGAPVYTKTQSITVSGTVTESYGIKEFTINGENAGSSDGPFSKPITLTGGEGEKTLTITLKDKAGKEVFPQPIKVVVDTTAPVFETSTALPADQIQFAGQRASGVSSDGVILTSNNPLKVTGLIKDPVSGETASRIKEVQYVVTEKTVTTAPSAGWQQLNGTHESNGNYRLSGFVQVDGEKKVWIKAVDNADNETVFSHEVKVVPAAVIEWTLELENNSPSGTVKYNAGTWYAKGQFKVKIGGTLDSAPPGGSPMNVEIKQGSTPPIAPTAFFDDWTGHEARIYPTDSPNTYTVKSGQTEGEYTITISAQKQVKLLTFTIDGTAPTITPASSGNGVLPANNAWVNKKALYVEGTAADATSGIEKIEASVNGTEKLLSTDASWSGYLTLNEGNNTVQFKVTDKAGNFKDTSEQTIKVDTGRPTIGLTTPADGQALINSTSTSYPVAVTVSDTGGSGIAKVEYATTVGFASPQSAAPSGGSATINLTGINGDTTYYFRAVDNAGNTSDSVRVTIQKDNAPPTITFDSPQNNQIVNKKITIRGSASDNNGLQSVKIVKVDGTALTAGSVSASSGADGGKAEFTGTKAYNWKFDLDTAQYPDGDLKLKAITTDAAGNTKEETLTLKVDQDSDRPKVTINSFEHLSSAKLAGTRKISGVVEDDDGAVKKVEIKIGAEGYKDADMSAGNTLWSISVPDTVADNPSINFKIKVTDAKDSVFESSDAAPLKQPKLLGKDDASAIGTDFTFVLDTQPPEIMSNGVKYTLGASYGADEKLLTSGEVVGNKTDKKFSVRVFAYDKSGIGSVSLKLGSATVKTGVHTSGNDTIVDGKTFEAWDITDIDLTEEGAIKLEITVKDNSGFEKVWSEVIKTDFTDPTINKTAPTADTVAFKDMTIVGEFSDNPSSVGIPVSGIVPDSLMYKIGNSGWIKKHESGGKVLSELTKTGSTWEIKIKDFPEYNAALGAVAPTGSSQIWKITLKLKGKDAAGNEVESIDYELKFDPNGSTPMIEILSPHDGDKLGTGVAISGIARTANPAATDKVTKIKLRLYKPGTTAGTSWTLDGKDYGTGVDIVSEPGGINFWSYTLPQNVVTGILNGATDAEVFFQVQGVAGSTTGSWTVGRKFSISSDVAQFADIKLDGTAYTPLSKWIKGSASHITGKVTHSSGIVSASTSSTNLPSGVHPLHGVGTAGWFTDISNGKEFNIPIDTTHYTEQAGNIEFTISAKDGRTDGTAREVFTTIRVKYDNSVPLSAIGEIGLSKYNDKANKADFTGGVFTDFAGVIKDTKHELYTVVVNQKKYAVSSIVKVGDNHKVTLADASSLNGTGLYYMIVKKYDIISGSAFKFEGSVEDSGSGPVEVKAELTIPGATEKAEAQAISKNEAGNLYGFSGNLDTTQVPNGNGTLKITVTDGASNQTSELIPVRVKNNPLTISKVTFKTDLSGNGGYENDTYEVHQISSPTAPPLNADQDYRYAIDVSSVFAYKNKTESELVVELAGGYGSSRTVKLYKNVVAADHEVTSETASAATITLNLNGCFADKDEAAADTPKNKIGDKTDQKLILVVTDEVAGDPKPWHAQMDITVTVDVKDDIVPTGYIMPMYYNSKTDNSVDKTIEWNDPEETTVKSITEHGHIEYSKITALNDHQSLSGKVKLRGIAYDNIRLSKIELTGVDATVSNTYTSGAWSTLSALKIVSEKLTNTGHYVEWEYVWNTGTPETGHTVGLTVTDAANTTNAGNDEEPTALAGTREADLKVLVVDKDSVKKGQFISFGEGEALYLVQVTEVTAKDKDPTKEKLRWEKVNGNAKNNVPETLTSGKLYAGTSQKKSKNVNIVPYVTALKRPDTYNTHRSSSGAYNLLRGDTVTVEGFNLTGEVKATIPGEANAQTVSGSTFPLPATAKSGKVKITAGGVEAINNLTNNGKPYNRQEIANRPETQYWTDDIEVHVWKDDEQFEGSENPKYPSMAMMSNGTLYAAFSNYSTSRVYYSGINESATEIFAAYDPPEEAAISISDANKINVLYSANYHGGSSSHWNASFEDAGGLYCYDSNAKYFYNDYRHYGKAYRFELFYHNKQLQQFKNFRIARKSDRIHIAYYDSLANSIKYSSVDASSPASGDFTNNKHEIAWVDLDGGADLDTKTDPHLKRIGTVAVLVDTQFEGGTTTSPFKRSSSTAEYCAIALDGNNMPVVVYADVDSGTLRLARASKEKPIAASDWKVQKVLTETVNPNDPNDYMDPNIGIAEGYFTAKFDSEGKLHIAFRNTRGQLCYVKSRNANAGASAYSFDKSVIIDEAGSLADLSLDGTIPYISYMSKVNAFDGIRIARYDSELVTKWKNDGTFETKGAWNVMTAGMKNRASNVRTCVAVAPSTVTTWKAAVGYTPGNVYRVVKYIGE